MQVGHVFVRLPPSAWTLLLCVTHDCLRDTSFHVQGKCVECRTVTGSRSPAQPTTGRVVLGNRYNSDAAMGERVASISPEDGIGWGSSGITRGEQEGKQAVRRAGRNEGTRKRGNKNRKMEIHMLRGGIQEHNMVNRLQKEKGTESWRKRGKRWIGRGEWGSCNREKVMKEES